MLIYILQLEEEDIAALGRVTSFLQRIQVVPVEAPEGQPEMGSEPTQLALIEGEGTRVEESEETPEERTPDPMFNPPVPAPPVTPQADFGAGPIRGGIS